MPNQVYRAAVIQQLSNPVLTRVLRLGFMPLKRLILPTLPRIGAASSRDGACNRIALCPLIGVRAKSKDGFSDFPQVFWWQFRLYKGSPDVLKGVVRI